MLWEFLLLSTAEVNHRFCYASTGRDEFPVDIYGRNVGGFGFVF